MFRLLIECTKDIDTLQINFSDGTSVITEKTEKTEKSRNDKIKIDEHCENTDEEALEAIKVPDVSDRPKKVEGQKPPEIPDLDRPPKIDEVLNNLDF